jgi:hypothetical protein
VGQADLLEPLVDGEDLAGRKARSAPSIGATPEGSPEISAPTEAQLCFYGLCGGGGVTTVAAAVGFGKDASATGLPAPNGTTAQPLVAVTRSHAHGLQRAQQEAAAWAAHGHTGSWRQVGLVVVADAPGRLPRPLQELLDLASGGWPRVWRVDWFEVLRLGEPPTAIATARSVANLRNDLLGLLPDLDHSDSKEAHL